MAIIFIVSHRNKLQKSLFDHTTPQSKYQTNLDSMDFKLAIDSIFKTITKPVRYLITAVDASRNWTYFFYITSRAPANFAVIILLYLKAKARVMQFYDKTEIKVKQRD